MAIRLLDIRYGAGFFQEVGTIVTLPEDEEKQLVQSGRAEYVTTPMESTAIDPPATTTTTTTSKSKLQTRRDAQ